MTGVLAGSPPEAPGAGWPAWAGPSRWPPGRARLLGALALAAGTLLLYAPVAGFEFVHLDDNRYVIDNPRVRGGISWDGVLWAFTTLHASNWHPLTWLSHMLDVELFGVRAGPHHLVNALLHAVDAALLFLALSRMTGARGRSLLVAALFAVHPLHVESVAWVAERKDVLSTLFGLLALLAYARHAERPRAGTYLAVVLAFAASLLSKPMWVTFPFLLLVLDFWPLRRMAGSGPADGGDALARPVLPLRRLLLEKLPLLALSAASSTVTVVAQGRGGSLAGLELPVPVRLANAAVSYVGYVRMTLWPADLAVFYPFREVGAWEAIGAAALLAAATALAIRRARAFPELAVGWLWFAGTLVPVVGVVQVGSQALADRYAYLPSAGLFLAAA
ncbi:MAG TPA: glycosyltransferase family 39 protein, partial [Anaeromyxobacteraceae bacterium]|nr:glycosyltransferase family 39 protein [Anaeromyxobacteraceae bacterium]